MIQCVKKLTFLIFILLNLSGCKEISFREPQPKGKRKLTSIPEKLQGKYLLEDENGINTDTLFVTSAGYRIGNDLKHEARLSDSLILKYFKGYYFLNMRERPKWYLRILQKEKDGNLVCMTMETANQNFYDYINRLSTEIKIDSVKSNDGMLYQIDPSPKKLIDLIKKGFVKKMILKKI